MYFLHSERKFFLTIYGYFFKNYFDYYFCLNTDDIKKTKGSQSFYSLEITLQHFGESPSVVFHAYVKHMSFLLPHKRGLCVLHTPPATCPAPSFSYNHHLLMSVKKDQLDL